MFVACKVHESITRKNVNDMNKTEKQTETPQVREHSVSGSFVFDRELLEKCTIKNIEYFIGIDTLDKRRNAYCLSREVDGVMEIVLSKTMNDKTQFKQEVENLSKYFNAQVVGFFCNFF